MPEGLVVAGRITHSKKYNQRKAAAAAEARRQGLEAAKKELTPYSDYGRKSLERQERLFTDPSYLEETGGYKFTLDQGLKGTTAARSRSSIFSGETLKALTEYASGLAQQTYTAEWDRFQKGIDTGLQASGTIAEIEAGKGEAEARKYDQMAAWYAGQESFGRQIAGQWSGAFAGASSGAVTGGGG